MYLCVREHLCICVLSLMDARGECVCMRVRGVRVRECVRKCVYARECVCMCVCGVRVRKCKCVTHMPRIAAARCELTISHSYVEYITYQYTNVIQASYFTYTCDIICMCICMYACKVRTCVCVYM